MTTCPITGEPATNEDLTSESWQQYNSPAAGGRFQITRSAGASVTHLLPIVRTKLVTWLVEQHLAGIEIPRITSARLEAGQLPALPTVPTRIDRLLLFLSSVLPAPGGSLPTEVSRKSSDDPWGGGETWAYLRAWTSSQAPREAEAVVRFAAEEGLVAIGSDLHPTYRISLTLKGWRRLEELKARRSSSEQGFVAMWFGAEVQDAYDLGIEPAIRRAGYLPMRIDRKEHTNKIDDEIIAEIRRSHFVIADFTCGTVDAGGSALPIPRGGVYYEAGFAQGLGIPVIWTCRGDQIGQVHFDTRQFNHIIWEKPEDLRVKLAARISAVLGDGPYRLASAG